MQLCLQMELAGKNHNHFSHRSHPGKHNKWTSRQKKKRYSECYKKVFYAGPKYFGKLKPQSDTTRKTQPDLQL